MIGRDELLQKAAELKKNGFKTGCDGMSAKSAELWMAINGERLLGSFFRGDYDPMPAEGFRVAKKNGAFRILTRMTAIDSILQRCILEAVRADCEKTFSDNSYAYRAGRGVNAALQKYCEYGSVYRLAAKIDPYQCFDTMDHEVLRESLQVFFDDEVLVKNLMKFAQMPVLEDGEPTERECGIPQGSPLGPLFCNIYMHSLDMLLQERDFPFIRYADDIVLFANDTASLSAGIKLAESHLTQKLKLKPNPHKSQQGPPFGIKYLGHSFYVGKDGILTVGEGESVSAAYHAWHSRKVKNPGKTIHILSDGILRRKDQSLLLDTETGNYNIPSRNTDIINFFSDVILDSGFLLTASRNGITVNVFDAKGHLLGSYLPNRPLRSPKVTVEQLYAYHDENHRCELAKAFILGSIHNFRLNIRYYNKNRPDPIYDSVLNEVKTLERRIITHNCKGKTPVKCGGMEINMEIGILFRCSETTLPMNYQYYIQSMIYRGLSEDSAYASFLHDAGYTFGSRQFRLFTFSRLSGYYQIRQGCLIYPEAAALRVRSIEPRMIKLLCCSFFPGSEHVLCGQKLVVEEFTVSDYHICTDSINFTTCSPLVAYRTEKGERARFFTPDDPEFYELLSDNAARKWSSYYKEPAPGHLEIFPLEGRFKKVVAEYKGTYITGWMGSFHAEGPEPLLDFLYQTGMGAKNSQGFGMINID